MISPRFTSVIFTLSLSIFIALPTLAAEGWYVGLSGGEAQFDGIKYPVTASVALIGAGAQPVNGVPVGSAPDPAIFGNGDLFRNIVTPAVSIDDDDTSWKISVGYQLNKYLALEASYFDAGEAKIAVKTVQPSFTEAPFVLPEIITHQSSKYKVKGLDISALGSYAITEKFSVLAKLGAIYSKTKLTGRISTKIADAPPLLILLPNDLSYSDDNDNFKLTTGLGLQYRISESFSTRLEWTRYLDVLDRGYKETNVDNYSLGIYYHFK